MSRLLLIVWFLSFSNELFCLPRFASSSHSWTLASVGSISFFGLRNGKNAPNASINGTSYASSTSESEIIVTSTKAGISWTKNQHEPALSLKEQLGANQASEDQDQTTYQHKKVLILDVDGTLYFTKQDDFDGIEAQIKKRTHNFLQENLSLSPHQVEEIFREHGSVLGSIRNEEMRMHFFHEVYDPISFSSLRECSLISEETGISLSGYDNLEIQYHRGALDSLKAITASCDIPIVIASNSPVAHVHRVLEHLGLADLKMSLLITPDFNGQGFCKSEKNFWNVLLSKYPPDVYNMTLIDDSLINCNVAKEMGIGAMHVSSENSFVAAFLNFLDVLDCKHLDVLDGNITSVFNFNAVDYLRAKNLVDDVSYCKDILKKVGREIYDLRMCRRGKLGSHGSTVLDTYSDKIVNISNDADDINYNNSYPGKLLEGVSEEDDAGGSFVVVDLGAGVLNMLRHVLMLSNDLIERGDDFKALKYVAFERNKELLGFCRTKLLGLGFQECFAEEHPELSNGLCFQLNLPTRKAHQPMEISIFLVAEDFMSKEATRILDIVIGKDLDDATTNGVMTRHPIDLIIGSCVADLIPPAGLCCALRNLAGLHGSVVYLPITFTGRTEIIPSNESTDFDPHPDVAALNKIASAYDIFLKDSGHHMSSTDLIRSIGQYGGKDVEISNSTWKITSSSHRYMWIAMYRFILLGALFPLLSGTTKSDIHPRRLIDCFKHLLNTKTADIIANNIDILFKYPPRPAAFNAELNDREIRYDYHVQFTAPYEIRIEKQTLPDPFSIMGDDKVLVRSSCSLVSTGTELKVFRGEFEKGQAADLTIESLVDTEMSFPLRYGYCMVGRIDEENEFLINDAKTKDLLGKLVFVFAPHGQYSISSVNDLIIVPEGISEEDAVFAPSVETAVSMVQDAAPILGEKVAIIGQGLIGVLTASVLHLIGMDVTIVDISERRLEASAQFINGVAAHFNEKIKVWNPLKDRNQDDNKNFDVCIELTGKVEGLQTAIDSTGYGGRIIVGSWFSGLEEKIKLGATFHRSHISIKASQVSNIPGKLSDRFTKMRRFDIAWNILKRLKPSRLLQMGSDIIKFDPNDSELDNQFVDAYSRLDKGEYLTVLIDYRKSTDDKTRPKIMSFVELNTVNVKKDSNINTNDPSEGLTITVEDEEQ